MIHKFSQGLAWGIYGREDFHHIRIISANLSSIFTIDKDNMPRLAVAGWSLGAYQVIAPNPPASLQIQ